MQKFASIAIAIALFIIAGNMTYDNVQKHNQDKVAQAQPAEHVVEVVGKYVSVFDGIGAVPGFIIRDNGDLKYAQYDNDSVFDKTAAPKYLSAVTYKDGTTQYSPLISE